MDMTYHPKPPDLSNIELPPDLHELMEQLAQNTHETWAAQRLAEGWRFGECRDDFKKEHPCLVPYDRLPESEKEYDRKITLGVLLGILSRGYRLDLDSGAEERRPHAVTLASANVSIGQQLIDPSTLDIGKTIEIWRILKSKNETFPREVYQRFGTNILGRGEPLLAFDIIVEGLKHWPKDVNLRQLQALSLLRSGAIHRALRVLERLKKEGHDDEETLGLLARAHKDLAAQAEDLATRRRQWDIAYKSYLRAYNQTGGYWTGINAATMALLVGRGEKALSLAQRVLRECLLELDRLQGKKRDLYWLKATLGEASLISKDLAAARRWYSQAAKIARARYGDLSTSRRNARLVMKALNLQTAAKQRIESCFRIPRIATFAGHMFDHPGPRHLWFPPHLEQAIQQRIKALLQRMDIRIGYASIACASDLLFLETMLKTKGEINIVLPFSVKEYKKAQVTLVPESNWGKRFDKLLKQASRVVIASENRTTGNAVVYEYCNLLKDGLANLRAKMLDAALVPIVVWDGKSGDSPADTSAMVQNWRSQGLEPEIIDISDLLADSPGLELPAAPVSPLLPGGLDPAGEFTKFPQEIRAMLFADVVGYTRLMEEQIPDFINHFIGTINDLIAEFPYKPLLKNTWGDALYCVFANVSDAGNFSLLLQDRISAINWTRYGLPENLDLRISLHAGPVFLYEDPLHQGPYYTGVHVSRAARIEPITPIGQVYASQQFAALVSTQHVKDFICDYVGRVPLPKQAGIIPLYLVRRSNPLPRRQRKKTS
jgi:class 3 adenylate cyclase/tetratricopeptide (TPR) repeat protein